MKRATKFFPLSKILSWDTACIFMCIFLATNTLITTNICTSQRYLRGWKLNGFKDNKIKNSSRIYEENKFYKILVPFNYHISIYKGNMYKKNIEDTWTICFIFPIGTMTSTITTLSRFNALSIVANIFTNTTTS